MNNIFRRVLLRNVSMVYLKKGIRMNKFQEAVNDINFWEVHEGGYPLKWHDLTERQQAYLCIKIITSPEYDWVDVLVDDVGVEKIITFFLESMIVNNKNCKESMSTDSMLLGMDLIDKFFDAVEEYYEDECMYLYENREVNFLTKRKKREI